MDRLTAQLNLQSTALNLRAARQELLASNIANADTPNFKARDLDFKSALAGAMAGRTSNAVAMNRTSVRHFEGSAPTNTYGDALKYRTEFQPNADGNTVNMDVERAAFADNALRLEAALTFLNKQLTGLQMAIQGQ